MIPVVWQPQPFKPSRFETRPEGMSLADIVSSLSLPRRFWRDGIVTVGGQEVPNTMWHRVRPKANCQEAIVTLQIRLLAGGGDKKAGGGGGKNVIALVATIAVVAVAAAVSGGALGPAGLALLGTSFGAGGLGAAALGAAISVGGMLALSALAPPPTVTPTAGGLTGPETSKAQGVAALSGNILSPGSPLARVIGTHRVFPAFLCEPLVERIGDDEYAEVVMGLAGPHLLEDIMIGDVLASDIPEIQTEVNSGFPGEVKSTLIQRQSKSVTLNVELSPHKFQEEDDGSASDRLDDQTTPTNSVPFFHRMVTRDSPDEVWIPTTFPEGHFDQTDFNDRKVSAFRIRLRPRNYNLSPTDNDGWIHLPEVHLISRSASPFAKTIKLLWRAVSGATPTPVDQESFIRAYTSVPAQNVAPIGSVPQWVADSNFYAGSGDTYMSNDNMATTGVRSVHLYDDRVEFFLDPNIFPPDVYDIEIKKSLAFQSSSFTQSSYVYNGDIYDFFSYRLDGTVAKSVESLANRKTKCVVPRCTSIWNEHPVPADNIAAIYLRIKNRSIQDISVLASGYVYDWNGSTWEDVVTTSNPAPHFRDVLFGTLNAEPLPLDLLDEEELLEWRVYCDANGLTVNAVVAGQSALQVATMIAACGWSRPRQSELWGVMTDKDRSAESPVQLFSPRTLRGFRWERGFPKLADGFRARFSDSDNLYRETEIIVLDPAVDTGGERLEDIRYDGLVTATDVALRALFDLAQIRARPTTYSAEVAWESLRARRGDLIAVQHETLQSQAGFARIKHVIRNSDNSISGLILDGSVPNDTVGFFEDSSFFSDAEVINVSPGFFFGTPRLGVAVATRDQAVAVFEVEGDDGDVKELSLPEPYDDPNEVIAPGCHLTAGPLGSEYKRLILMGVAPKQDLTAALTFVDEAPELWS